MPSRDKHPWTAANYKCPSPRFGPSPLSRPTPDLWSSHRGHWHLGSTCFKVYRRWTSKMARGVPSYIQTVMFRQVTPCCTCGFTWIHCCCSHWKSGHKLSPWIYPPPRMPATLAVLLYTCLIRNPYKLVFCTATGWPVDPPTTPQLVGKAQFSNDVDRLVRQRSRWWLWVQCCGVPYNGWHGWIGSVSPKCFIPSCLCMFKWEYDYDALVVSTCRKCTYNRYTHILCIQYNISTFAYKEKKIIQMNFQIKVLIQWRFFESQNFTIKWDGWRLHDPVFATWLWSTAAGMLL